MLFWFLLGFGMGGSLCAIWMNTRFMRVLDVIEGETRKLCAYHDEIVRGLIAANDSGRRKRDPLS